MLCKAVELSPEELEVKEDGIYMVGIPFGLVIRRIGRQEHHDEHRIRD